MQKIVKKLFGSMPITFYGVLLFAVFSSLGVFVIGAPVQSVEKSNALGQHTVTQTCSEHPCNGETG